MTRRAFMLLAFSLSRVTALTRRDVRVGVFGLLHPRELIVRSGNESPIALLTDRDTYVLRGNEEARVRAVSGSVEVSWAGDVLRPRALHIRGGTAGVVEVELNIPGKISRTFCGGVDIVGSGDELVPAVSMELETAVASVIAAEQAASTPIEALKSLAVAARSYFTAASGRHRGFDFCDTTHCQFLRESPAADHPAALAAHETTGLVLAFRGAPIAALYSASCGGRTRSLAEDGLSATDAYPYFSVECLYCARHAKEWDSRLAIDPRTRRLEVDRSENARLAVGRRNGWSAVPGNDFEMTRELEAFVLHGRGRGHGVGLCQAGAAGLAEEGASCSDILAHYYPGTTLKITE
jgi:stage II sporulation protein D